MCVSVCVCVCLFVCVSVCVRFPVIVIVCNRERAGGPWGWGRTLWPQQRHPGYNQCKTKFKMHFEIDCIRTEVDRVISD